MTVLVLLSCFSAKKVKYIRIPGAEEGIALCPGIHTPLTVRVKQSNGRVRTTGKRGREGLKWNEVIVRMNERSFEDGSIWLSADPRKSYEQSFALEVFLVDRPEIAFSTTVTARYDCAFVADFTGYSGEIGSDDSIFAHSGWDGVDGGHGGHAGSAEAYVTMVEGPDGRDFIQARVTGYTNPERRTDLYFLIDPDGGELIIDVSGGPGGAGESGHDGDDGDDGEEDEDGDVGWGEDGDDGGNGGDGGDGGDGGSATVVLDPSVEPHGHLVSVRNAGGASGAGGTGGDGGWGGSGTPDGSTGSDGYAGRDGRPGRPGPSPEVRVEEVHKQF